MTGPVNDPRTLGDAGRTVQLGALGVGAAALVVGGLCWFGLAPERFFRSYLVGWLVAVSIALGGLIFVMIQHATRAGWSASVRRLWEATAANFQWLWLGFIPVALGMLLSDRTHFYEWNVTAAVERDAVLMGKSGYLDPTFWLIRGAVFLGIWALLSRFFLRHSVAQDADRDVAHTHAMQRLAPLGILLFAVTITLAAIDWIMSLSPHWFSTIFGVYFFACSAAAFFSFCILLIWWLQRQGKLHREVTPEHQQDLGKLLFAFGIVFWAYIGFSQFMLIWYANIPEETTWFMIRGIGGWYGVSALLLVGHFIVPFLALLSKHPKRRSGLLAIGAAWMLLMVCVDVYWLVMPVIPTGLLAEAATLETFVDTFQHGVVPEAYLVNLHYHFDADHLPTWADLYGFRPHLADAAFILGFLGLFLGATLARLRSTGLVAVGDPRLPEALAFENM